MNCPSRTDELPKSDGHNQSPNSLSNDLTTNQDLKGLANSRRLRRTAALTLQSAGLAEDDASAGPLADNSAVVAASGTAHGTSAGRRVSATTPASAPSRRLDSSVLLPENPSRDSVRTLRPQQAARPDHGGDGSPPDRHTPFGARILGFFRRSGTTLVTFVRFMGPGFVVAVAYIDPGNYATDIAAGASYRFQLLFIVLLSNIFAIFLQSLSIKLGTVTGRNLAQACRAFLPRWLNIILYILAEIAIIATDIAEVIGTAIALNLLEPRIPLLAGCAISIVDVFVVLLFCPTTTGTHKSQKSHAVHKSPWRFLARWIPWKRHASAPSSAAAPSRRRWRFNPGIRTFEMVVAPLVLAVVVCFCIQLSLVQRTAGEGVAAAVLHGYLPSSTLVQPKALYQACGILGATVMPHSIYLGSGIVQSRLREFDVRRGYLPRALAEANDDDDDEDNDEKTYIPSLPAIRHSMKYSIAELALSLFTFALFVNSAILVVAGAALYGNADAEGADIFAIHDLLASSIAPAAGTIFALALLFSGLSAGVVCTVAGQMVSEGALHWTLPPWLRRLLTRSISIMPSIVIAGAVGRSGLDAALNATQVALSVVLPFVTAPLLWFTCNNKYMTVQGGARIERSPRHGAHHDAHHDVPAPVPAPVSTSGNADLESHEAPVKMANSWPVAVLGGIIWLIMAAMNVANLVLLGRD